MRVGDRTDFDRLFVEIETDGSIAPEEAMVLSSDILAKHILLIEDSFREKAEAAATAEAAPKKAKKTTAAKKTKKTTAKKHEEKKKGKKTK